MNQRSNCQHLLDHRKSKRIPEKHLLLLHWTSLVAQIVKVSAYNEGDPGSIPGAGRSSGEGNGNPLQYSHLENPMNRGVWQATVMGLQESDMT